MPVSPASRQKQTRTRLRARSLQRRHRSEMLLVKGPARRAAVASQRHHRLPVQAMRLAVAFQSPIKLSATEHPFALRQRPDQSPGQRWMAVVLVERVDDLAGCVQHSPLTILPKPGGIKEVHGQNRPGIIVKAVERRGRLPVDDPVMRGLVNGFRSWRHTTPASSVPGNRTSRWLCRSPCRGRKWAGFPIPAAPVFRNLRATIWHSRDKYRASCASPP